jgi:beta-glucosidase
MKAAIQSGGADSVMISYNRVNGLPACENPHILDTLRHSWGFQGFTAPDFALAVRDPQAAAQAGIDLPALDESDPAGRTAEMFISGQISHERLDDICRRILFAKFDAGLFDDPAVPATEDVSSPTHRNLARRIAEESFVLLKNDRSILPLPVDRGLSIAVIGAGRDDAMWTIGGSASVTLNPEQAVTPLAGITARLGAGGSVVFAQGTLGDVPLPPIPDGVLTPVQDGGTGLLGQYWNNPDQQGEPALVRVDTRIESLVKPTEISCYPWSARWTGTIHPPATGLYRFALLTAGIAKVFVTLLFAKKVVLRHASMYENKKQDRNTAGSVSRE